MSKITMIVNKLKHVKEIAVEELDKLEAPSIRRTVELIPHFVYSNTTNEIIGEIYLTEDQANKLNEFMKYKGPYNQDIAFLRE